MEALDLFEAGICGCGFHKTIAHDPKNWFQLEDQFCPLCADIALQDRIRTDAERGVVERLADTPSAARPSDGRTSIVRQMTPVEADAKRAEITSRRGSRTKRLPTPLPGK